MSACFDGCSAPATRKLRGLWLCTPHYIEALEHSAHIVSTPMGLLVKKITAEEAARLGPLREIVAKRIRDKEAREEATGRPADFSAPSVEPSSPPDEPAAPGAAAES